MDTSKDHDPKPQKESRLSIQELKKLLQSFKESEILRLATVIMIVAVYFPQILFAPEGQEELACLIENVQEQDAKQTLIRCSDGSMVSLDYVIGNIEIVHFSAEQMNDPRQEDISYLDDEGNPNFNCHSYTMQVLQEQLGIDLGADESSWLNSGIEDFLKKFGTTVTTGTVELRGRETAIDPAVTQTGDVVLYFRHDGSLLHSAVVTDTHKDRSGKDRVYTASKTGPGAELLAPLEIMAWYYELDGSYDDASAIGGGTFTIYRVDPKTIPTITQKE